MVADVSITLYCVLRKLEEFLYYFSVLLNCLSFSKQDRIPLRVSAKISYCCVSLFSYGALCEKSPM